MFSTQAAYAAPILQLATNRQSEHDRARAEHDFLTNAQTLALLRRLISQLGVTQDEVEQILAAVTEP